MSELMAPQHRKQQRRKKLTQQKQNSNKRARANGTQRNKSASDAVERPSRSVYTTMDGFLTDNHKDLN